MLCGINSASVGGSGYGSGCCVGDCCSSGGGGGG